MLTEDAASHQPCHRQRGYSRLAAETVAIGHPDHVRFVERRHPLCDVEDLLDGRRCLPPVCVLVVLTGQCAHRGPGGVAYRDAGGDESRVRILDAFQSCTVQRGAKGLGRLQQLQRNLILEVGQCPAGHPLDHLRAQLRRRGAGHAGDQFVGLVDDHSAVFGNSGAAMHGVDREQCVIGDHEVGGASRVPGALDKALITVRTALRTQALPDRDRDLSPRSFGMGRRVIPVGQATSSSLLLSPPA